MGTIHQTRGSLPFSRLSTLSRIFSHKATKLQKIPSLFFFVPLRRGVSHGLNIFTHPKVVPQGGITGKDPKPRYPQWA